MPAEKAERKERDKKSDIQRRERQRAQVEKAGQGPTEVRLGKGVLPVDKARRFKVLRVALCRQSCTAEKKEKMIAGGR